MACGAAIIGDCDLANSISVGPPKENLNKDNNNNNNRYH